MATFLAALAFMLIVVAGMAVGVIFGRKPISGSCGGMAALGMETECDVCRGDKSRCETEVKAAKKAAKRQALADLAVDATKQ